MEALLGKIDQSDHQTMIVDEDLAHFRPVSFFVIQAWSQITKLVSVSIQQSLQNKFLRFSKKNIMICFTKFSACLLIVAMSTSLTARNVKAMAGSLSPGLAWVSSTIWMHSPEMAFQTNKHFRFRSA